ncbi:MAG: FimV/HubP family polar landmark protein [Pseudomonadota bacterium]
MNRLLMLILLAVGMTPLSVLALGLGEIQVSSKLNEPLAAEIELLYDDPTEPESTEVSLASAADFERVGLDVESINVPLEFEIAQNAAGRYVIVVRSLEPVTDPFVDFLIEVNWPNGRLLREYVVLLDPPVAAGTAEVTPTAPPPTTTPPQPTAERTAPETTSPTVTSGTSSGRSASTGASGGNYEVVAGDTLWEIARDYRPDGVTINQMMMALYRLNPDAFFEDNINALRRGAILRMPDGGDLSSQSVAQALANVRTQNEAWESYRVSQSGRTPTVSDTTASADYVAPSRPTDPTPDTRLELVPPSGTSTSAADRPGEDATNRAQLGQLRDDLARSREDLIATNQENQELRSRIDDLERLVENYERTISLKDADLADLQNQIELTGQAVDDFSSDVGDTTGQDAASLMDSTGEALDQELAAIDQELDAAGSVDAPVDPEPEEVAPEEPAETTPTPVRSEPGMMDQIMGYATNPLVLGGVGLLALLGIGGTVISRRRKAASEERGESLIDRMTSAEAATNDLPVVDTDAPADSPPSLDDLKDAADAEPENAQTHLAYLRAAYAAEDRDRFVAGAEAMAAGLGGTTHAAWMEVRAMGGNLAPDAALFSEAAAAAEEIAEDTVSDDDLNFDLDGSDVDVPDDGGLDDDMDLDLDGGDDMSLDLDGDGDGDLSLSLDDDGDDDLSLDLDGPEPAAADDDLSLDFDLDGADGPASEAPAAVEEDTEFELQAVTDSTEAETAESELPDTDPEEASQTLAELESAEEDLGDLSLEDLDSAEMFGDEDAVGTKLDLAKAYIDMGDPEGARGMLEEVIAEGSDTQKGEAQGLLDGLS